ncbi:MAG: polyribonucleotide nucleotidyltransferase [Candidatus Wildermuthbacteria bacterium]|nr:polyribonucleotide nucleotidyltransferase [Candidatus Wildermuthbacteria bacterium]
MEPQQFSLKTGDKEISLTLNNWTEQANGSAIVRMGDTTALVTAVMGKNESPSLGYFPLMVDYEERFYAAGRILGSRYMRREGRPADEAIITARVIDRAIRPLFAQTMRKEVQVITTCLAWDGEHDPDVLGLFGASVALSLSDIPWAGPLGAARVGRIGGQFILNPTYKEREQSDIDFIVAGVQDGGNFLVNMIEASGKEASESVFGDALAFAEPFLKEMVAFQRDMQARLGKQKAPLVQPSEDAGAGEAVRSFLQPRLRDALFAGDKGRRMDALAALKQELMAHLQAVYPEAPYAKDADFMFEREVDALIHNAALTEGKRVDDRALDEIRELSADAQVIEKVHGSAIFARAQTKTLSLLTLGAPGDQKILEGMEFIGKKRFMHHYNFPPYAPGEVKPMRGPGRREIGHGMLAEKALLPVIPNAEQFPYTIRVVTEVLSSNGSTSMASVCSSTLALMDAGVPIARPVAGISIGLMSDGKGKYALLTDIQGPEDHYGDMDFKVAGTAEGITAIQLDVKIKGIPFDIFASALERARNARMKILNEVITKVLPAPRPDISKWAPRISVIRINPEKIGAVIGSGGKTINKLIDQFAVSIDIEEDGTVYVSGTDKEGVRKAIEAIEGITREAKVGEEYEGKVTRIMTFGAFVELWPGQEGMVHISKLSDKRVDKVSDVVNVGDRVKVRVAEIDEQGRVNLSMKK